MDNNSPIKRRRLNTPSPPAFIPNDLIFEILSLLPVKAITQLRCVSKSWNSLISDPIFTDLHFKKSSQNPKIVFSSNEWPWNSIISLPVSRLLGNPSSIAVSGDVCSSSIFGSYQIVGSSNGLLCLLQNSNCMTYSSYWFYIWNPATRTISDKLGYFRDYEHSNFIFSFDCDYLTGTYKIIVFHAKQTDEYEGSIRYEVKIFSLGDNCWRDIQNFPFVPLGCSDGAHLSGTINWLALRDDFKSFNHENDQSVMKISVSDVEQFVIVSLDLSTETYKEFLLPSGFDIVPQYKPSLRIIRDCICFSHDIYGVEFVIWQMKEFGVQESWTQLLRIDYVNLQVDNFPIYDESEYISFSDDELDYIQVDDHALDLSACMDSYTLLFPWYLSKNGDTMILLSTVKEEQFIIYNRREERVVKTEISDEVYWHTAIDYVESLGSTCWKSVDIEEEEEDKRIDYIDRNKLLKEAEERDDDLSGDGLCLCMLLEETEEEEEELLNDIDHGVDDWDDLLLELDDY